MDEFVLTCSLVIFDSYISAEMYLFGILRTTKLEWIAFLKPCIRNLNLISVSDFLFEHTITVTDSAAICTISKCCKGVKEACCKSSQTTVSKCRIRFLIFDTVKVKSQLFESFFYFTVSAKVDQVVSESTSHQEFHGHIVYDLRILFVISFLCCKPVINDNVFYRVAYCLENLLLCSFFNCFSIEEFYVVFYAFLECLFLEHFVCHFIPPVMVSLFTLFSAIHLADIAGEPLHSVNSSVFSYQRNWGQRISASNFLSEIRLSRIMILFFRQSVMCIIAEFYNIFLSCIAKVVYFL